MRRVLLLLALTAGCGDDTLSRRSSPDATLMVRRDSGLIFPNFDAAPRDARSMDAGRPDARPAPDAESLDALPFRDAESLDALPFRDATPADATPPDATPADADPLDAGPPDAFFADAAPRRDASTVDAGAGSCIGMADPSPFLRPCAPANTQCLPAMSCACSNRTCGVSTCTAAGCQGTESGTLRCNPNTNCDVTLSGSGVCGFCEANSVCRFTINSSGGQQVTCAAGTDCTVEVARTSGGRTVDCTQATRCRVNGSASGYTAVSCGQDCRVSFRGGFLQVCCARGAPTRCPNGDIVCDTSC